MKKTIVIYGSSTGTCEGIAQTIARKLGVKALSVINLTADVINENVKVLAETGLSGKTVALFGCGDSDSNSDTFCGGMSELYKAAKEAGANILEGVSADDYTFDESESVVDGKFVGLALDNMNEEDKTEKRINAWLEKIKPAL